VSRPLAVVLVFAVAGVLVVAVVTVAHAQDPPPPPPPPPTEPTHRGLTAAEWAAVADERRRERDRARARARRYRAGLHKLRRVMRRRVERGGVLSGLLCLQGYEGSWRDPAPPFWGGLQMDLDFQRTYGRPLLARRGTADRWPPIAQLAVGVVAVYSGRGFSPWPTTRRYCGL
jgi:hypothetical protein